MAPPQQQPPTGTERWLSTYCVPLVVGLSVLGVLLLVLTAITIARHGAGQWWRGVVVLPCVTLGATAIRARRAVAEYERHLIDVAKSRAVDRP